MLRLSLSSVAIAALVVSGATVATARPASAPEVSRARYLMGTICEVTAYGEGVAPALEAALDEIARLETILSDYRQDSELSRLNREAADRPVVCSPDLFGLIAASTRLTGETDGAFDITVGPLLAAWGLRGHGRIPTDQEVARALLRVGAGRLVVDDALRSVRFSMAGMTLDPGAIGKGYALDAAARVLHQRGVDSALLNFGGQILALGAPSAGDGWEVGIAHPVNRDEEALTLRLRDRSASTSGSSERDVSAGGVELSHIVDPRSGRPIPYRGSVTVVATTATEADALSTALLVMGQRSAEQWIRTRPELSAIFLETDAQGRLSVTRLGNTTENIPARMGRAGGDKRGGKR